MRKLICAVVFSVAAIASVDGQVPTCDGRYPLFVKCEDGKVPTGYLELAECQGDLPGTGQCKNAIAFNWDYFSCSEDKKAEGNPPTYWKYCADITKTAECTHQRICSALTLVKDGKEYTYCEQKGEKTVTFRLVKGNVVCFPIGYLPGE